MRRLLVEKIGKTLLVLTSMIIGFCFITADNSEAVTYTAPIVAYCSSGYYPTYGLCYAIKTHYMSLNCSTGVAEVLDTNDHNFYSFGWYAPECSGSCPVGKVWYNDGFTDYGFLSVSQFKALCSTPPPQCWPTDEICNGKDDDCDGVIDDVLIQYCYSGTSSTYNKGECKMGVKKCENGVWTGCIGEALPQPEVCDGKDNNCDGKTEDFTVEIKPKLSGNYVYPRGPGSGGSILADVFVKMINPVPDDCNFKLNVYAVPNTGGHGHSGGVRPIGSIGMINGPTLKIKSGENIGSVLFTSGSVSETERIKVQMQYNGANVKEPKEAEIDIKVPELVALSAGSHYVLVGGIGNTTTPSCYGQQLTHSGNHYSLPFVGDKIKTIAENYYNKSKGHRIRINDMSLIWGGRFDICGDWKNPHSLRWGHPIGLAFDVNSTAVNSTWQYKIVDQTELDDSADDEQCYRAPESQIHYTCF